MRRLSICITQWFSSRESCILRHQARTLLKLQTDIVSVFRADRGRDKIAPQMEQMTETLNWLYSLEARGEIYKLERMDQALALIGNPHLKIRAVHIAGTKGKGSTAAMLD